MEIPDAFRVGLPGTIGTVLRRWGSTAAPAEIEGLEGTWVQVKGTPLPVPVLFRVDRAQDGRFIVTGLLIGHHDRREITWETLRQIKPATVVALIFAGFDPLNPTQAANDAAGLTGTGAEATVDDDLGVWIEGDDPAKDDKYLTLAGPRHRRFARTVAALNLWRATTDQPTTPLAEVTRPRASVAIDLGNFADVYLRHQAISPRRATTATAQELHISRATAIRRIEECRQRGLIPPKDTGISR